MHQKLRKPDYDKCAVERMMNKDYKIIWLLATEVIVKECLQGETNFTSSLFLVLIQSIADRFIPIQFLMVAMC